MKIKKFNKNKGRPFSQEWKDNISKARMGYVVPQEVRDKISRGHKGKKKSLEWRQQMSIRVKGSGNPMWRGGLSSLHQQIRNELKYRQWRSDVFQRDHYTCQICGDKNYDGRKGSLVLHADHIKPLTIIMRDNFIDSVEKAIICEELWNINNGRTLCSKCHGETPTYGAKAKNYV
jgi:hypothetical protein